MEKIDLSFQNWHNEFDRFWPEQFKVLKTFTLIGSFSAKYILFELNKYRGIIFYETNKGYKIWRGINLSFQNWLKEFDKFWPEQSKVSKIFTLMGSIWAKYILLELKKYRGVIFHKTEEGYKIWGGIDLLFQDWHKEFDKFWPECSKVSKKFPFNGLLLSKVFIVWSKKVERNYLSWHWRVMQNLKKNWLVAWKMRWGIWQIFTRALESVKIGTLVGSFCPK